MAAPTSAAEPVAACSAASAARATAPAPIPAAEPFSVCASAADPGPASVAVAHAADQQLGLAVEQLQHLVFQAAVAEGRPLEMPAVDRLALIHRFNRRVCHGLWLPPIHRLSGRRVCPSHGQILVNPGRPAAVFGPISLPNRGPG